MNPPDAFEEAPEAKLPRRDWILLPLLSLLTLAVLVLSTEAFSRRVFTTEKAGLFDCIILNDPSGVRAIPNSVCPEKSPEGEQIEYRFNSCGHRAGMECGPKTAGVYRIVMLGTSMALGTPVAREKTFAALLPIELTRRTGRKVELYNEALSSRFPDQIPAHFNEVLAQDPDLIIWILNAGDLRKLPPDPAEPSTTFSDKIKQTVKKAVASRSFDTFFAEVFDRTRTKFLLMDALYDASQSQYISASLKEGDEKMGYLKAQPTALWQRRLSELDADFSKVEGLAQKAGVPLVTVLLPRHPEASMVSMGTWPDGYDPYQLDRELRAITVNNGGTYIDILPYFRDIANPQLYYFPVDTHLNPRGHIAITELLAKELTSGVVRQLQVPHPLNSSAPGE